MPDDSEGKYEGWSNQATWAVALRVDNDYPSYRKMMDAPDLVAFVRNECLTSPKANQAELIAHWSAKRRDR